MEQLIVALLYCIFISSERDYFSTSSLTRTHMVVPESSDTTLAKSGVTGFQES